MYYFNKYFRLASGIISLQVVDKSFTCLLATIDGSLAPTASQGYSGLPSAALGAVLASLHKRGGSAKPFVCLWRGANNGVTSLKLAHSKN